MVALHRKRRWIVALALLLGFGLLAWMTWPQPSLLARATKLAQIDSWDWRSLNLLPSGYLWLSNQEVLSARERSGREVLFRYNLSSGKDVALVQLSQWFQKTDGRLDEALTSPGGQWILWWNDAFIQVAKLDGSQYARYPRHPTSDLFWVQDARHWVELWNADETPGANVRVRSPERPLETRTSFLPSDEITGYLDNGLVTPTGQLKAIKMPYGASLRVTFVEGNIGSNIPLSQQRLHAPDGNILQAQLSPQGDRIALLNISEPRYALPRFLRRFLPWQQKPVAAHTSVWISTADGKNMRELGSFPSKTFTALHWSPDGKRLSFVYQNALWTVPVE
jgi:hypothetical protein